ncbi:hypothetical protein BT96DRAFT_574116 [Gymnopus androsaceus JB14]|uniref:Uncharacterized protein n=1 Tax=Gymnopus androsaceus JB14 TaxID=1447944 RepID=A0A6A4HYZ9_9AGAR|nr:hypothetical protein BT96DRAFT_574116 [Gymnopus androsaceus JB14]
MFSSSKLFSFIVLLGLLALQTLAQSNAVTYNASYDDINAGDAGVPITAYKELKYTNWEVFNSPKTSESPPNLIALNDGAEIGNMSVSNTSRVFHLTGFYFGCSALHGESLVVPLVPCTVLVTGYSNKQQVAQSAYVYDATVPKQNVTGLGNVFMGLDEVSFQVAFAKLSMGLDNIQYVMYDKL